MQLNYVFVFFICFSATIIVQGIEYKVTDQVFFNIAHDEKSLGKIIIGLFGEIAPKTVKNFIKIASDGIDGNTYSGSTFHRVIPRFMIQGGDILTKNGSGSISIYGKYFDDETFQVKHTGPGFVSMANAGKDTNGCQFFITTIATPWLDKHHTVFGKVVEGQNIVHEIEHVKTDSEDCPVEDVVIQESGVIETSEPFYVSDQPYDVWAWIDASLLPLGMSFSILGIFHWLMRKLNV